MDNNEMLIDAISSNNYKAAAKALTHSASDNTVDVNMRISDGRSPLILALDKGALDIAELLINKGADVNTFNQYEQTPLIIASNDGHTKIAYLLIEMGASVNAVDDRGSTPLIFACGKGHKEIVELLMDKGADVNATNNAGNTPLILACANGHKEVADLLIKNGARVNAKNNSGDTPYSFASVNGHMEIADLLVASEAENGGDVSAGKSPEDNIKEGFGYLKSDAFKQEVEEAKAARDHAARDNWQRDGMPGLGISHKCCMCYIDTYGEETVLRLQNEALIQGNTLKAMQIEQKSAYRCKSCGREFCKDCLEKKAPGNIYGGKSCPNCGGLFEIVHG